MISYKARLDYVCKPKSKDADYGCEEISLFVDLPFVPFEGLSIKPTPNSEYISVCGVMLDITPDGDGLIVSLEDPGENQLRPWEEMKSEGWQLLV